MEKDIRWTCPACGHVQQEPMHSDPDAHFLCGVCQSCNTETELCPCEFGEIVDASPGSFSVPINFGKPQKKTTQAARRFARLGGQAKAAKYGHEHYVAMGKKGGQKILKKYGKEYFSKIRRKRIEKETG